MPRRAALLLPCAETVMKVSVVGAGYVGLVTAACLPKDVRALQRMGSEAGVELGMTGAAARPPAAAGRPELPAHQPGTAPCADAVHGPLLEDPQPVGMSGLHRGVAHVHGTGSERRTQATLRLAARLLHPRAQPGARNVDPDPRVLASPCDGIVGACGTVEQGSVLQAKGFPYRMADLFGRAERAAPFEGGTYVTLRLTSSMYHRFHAPDDGTVEHVSYIGGDTWNVNPIALERVQRLFCRNERAVIRLRLTDGTPLALVPVAAILVASIRLHFLDVLLHLRWPGPNEMPCNARVTKGEELGWFEHGSTIIVFAPPGCAAGAGHRNRSAHPPGPGTAARTPSSSA
jgi:phosphatidylserine decarboxylase precursor